MLLRSSEMECCNILMKYRITCLWNPQDSCSQPLFAPGLAWVCVRPAGYGQSRQCSL